MTFIVDGTNGLTFPNSTVQASSGVVLQVVNAINSTSASTTSTSYVTSGSSATITPKFATSKIYIMMSTSGRAGIGAALRTTMYRNSTALSGFTQTQQAGSGSIQYLDNGISLNYLDSPGTTSSNTYTLYFLSSNGTSCQVSVDGSETNITLMEIAA